MKLFIWQGDGVLQDYTPGMVVAIANDLQEALDQVRNVDPVAVGNFPADKLVVVDIGPDTPPQAWTTWGGA